jgi:glycosyltransferase involved in cell wall biosynthesis
VSQQIQSIRTGLGTYANNLIPALAGGGHEVVVVGRGDDPGWPGVEYHAVPRGAHDPTPEDWLSFAWHAARRVAALGRTRRPDVVHFLDAREALWARAGDRPLVGTIHDCYLAEAAVGPGYWKARYGDWLRRWAYHRVARRLERRALAKLALVVANSDYVRRAVGERYGFPPARLRTIYYGFVFPWDPPAEPSARRPEVLFVGANLERKGLPALLRAVAALGERVPGLRLHVVGDHPSRRGMEALARALDVAPRVTFHGFLPNEALAPLYRTVRALALPSEVEGFGITLLEAMHCGVPVIGTTRGGSAELVRDGWNGYLVEPGDVHGLTERLRMLLTDDAAWAALAGHGRETAARFTRARMVAETLDAYRAAGAGG